MMILSAFNAINMVAANPGKLNVISVDKSHVPNPCKNHLHLKIDDVDWEHAKPDSDKTPPSKEEILKAIAFDKQCDGQIDIIHCWAGLSRSPAIAYAILRYRGLSAEDAMKTVQRIVPHAVPNTKIVRLTEELLAGV